MSTQIEELTTQIVGLTKLMAEAAAQGDTPTMLQLAEEVGKARDAITSAEKEHQRKLAAENASLIMELELKARTEFDKAFVKLAGIIQRLGEFGHKVEIVSYAVDMTVEPPIPAFRIGPKGAQKKSTGTGSGGSKSSKVVVLADGTQMGTRDFVEAYATDEDKASKTWPSWPTSMAEKIAKRVGATIQKKDEELVTVPEPTPTEEPQS